MYMMLFNIGVSIAKPFILHDAGYYNDYLGNLFVAMYVTPQGRTSGIADLKLRDGIILIEEGKAKLEFQII